jgi:CheY-like chemotaxis protein
MVLDRALIADASPVLRSLLSKLLEPYATCVSVASSTEDALEMLQGGLEFSLVIADLDLPTRGGIALLEDVHALEGPRPAVLLTGRHVDVEAETRASLLGAIGTLAKPLTLPRIVSCLRGAAGPLAPASPRTYWQPVCAAVIVGEDDKAQELELPIHDLSSSGAFLGSPAPIDVGTSLNLRLEIPGTVLYLHARIVRLQEPGWGSPGGVGVVFQDVPSATQRRLDDYVSERLLGAPRLDSI